jgi:hypothetical protein
MEEFLRKAKVVHSSVLGRGITNSQRLTLELGGVTHDAHFQSVDESITSLETPEGIEMHFRDCWKFNVAAYRLDRLLGIRMTPPSVARGFDAKSGAFTWWIDNARMESDRIRKKLTPPNPSEWNKQMHVVHVFDQLIYNIDRNLENLLITPDWRLWMIDHTRAFRLAKALRSVRDLVRCERSLYARLQRLSEDEVRKATSPFLTRPEISGLMARRDLIVGLFRRKIVESGEDAVLYDYFRDAVPGSRMG